jgi:hypothetical protein
MSKFAEETKSVKSSARDKRNDRFQWLFLCEARGCSIRPSAYVNGSQLCTFHNGHEVTNWPAITEAVNTHAYLLKKIAELHHKPSGWWKGDNMLALQLWAECPMNKEEPPSAYLTRLNRHMIDKINQEASSLIESQ